MPTAEEILEGIRHWVEVESHTADVEGVNRLMARVAESYAEVGARIERIIGRDDGRTIW